ncbi:hypothetical protein P1J78_11900 [Psychromarinibacter sp. C21-152]|uniref:Uncharacterized protein n=1 Tax=Psychromarinibacter sediminicola TaxID=3033385 RepID=A0AAE3NQ27_9RHOB|nr:hypothetical protein [Psychromarinibacter sediminicola]MDF0601438.1 hypothetical protein [Psychromarinibacter sediminicola]
MTAFEISLFVLASLASSALLGGVLYLAVKRRADYRAFAAARGWTYRYEGHSGSRAARHIFQDPQEGWTLTIFARSSSTAGGSGSTTRWTEFDDPGPALAEGMAVLGPEIPEKAAAMADRAMGMMGGDLGRMLLNKLTGGLGAEAQDLRTVDTPGPGLLMATPGAEDALNPVRDAPELAEARAGRNDAQQPVVMRGPFGLRLRVAGRLRRETEIEAFVTLGRSLADRLRAG